MKILRLAAPMLLAAAAAAAAHAQSQRPLTPADWDHWKSIANPALSNDGRWAIYSLVPQVGDGELVLRSTAGSTEYRVPRGFIGRPQMTPGLRDTTALPGGQITADSRYAVALTYASMAEFDAARRAHKRPADQPKASLAIVDLANGRVASVARVKSFRLPKDAGGWLAYLLEEDSTAAAAASAGNGRAGAGRDSSARGPRRDYGTTLVLRNLSNGQETRIADVSAYTFDDSAKWLGYTTSSRTPARDGAYVMKPAEGREIALAAGHGNYRQLAFDRAGTQVAFVSDRDESAQAKPRYALYYASLAGTPSARTVVPARPIADGASVSDHGRVAFTKSGTAVLFGIAPPARDSIPADSLYDKASVDVWSWKDARLQSQQKVEAARDRARAFTTIYQIASGKVIPLASDSMPMVSVSDDGRTALAATSERYAVSRTWGDEGDDLWLIDATTGARKLIREKISGRSYLSPAAKYVLFFDRGHWYSYGVATGRTADLTAPLKGVHFEEETWDTPSEPSAWGTAGFTRGDGAVLVYDRFDVWELDPSGVRAPRVVTDSAGARRRVVFRVVDLDRDEPAIDPGQPLLLSAFNDSTKASGFWRERLGDRRPDSLVMADVAFGTPVKAKHASQYLLTRGTFIEFPNLYAGGDVTRIARISDANPQQKDFKWGSVELVSWTSADGIPLQGLLYKPADFDPHRKYPLIAYFYEKLSENLHQYVAPGGRNVINPTHYASNGYLIFEPDIHYETGYPGPSAEKSIIPGVESLIARGFVDETHMGLQGQSWGGYQTAFLVTRTRMFAAAMAGAPVANMTSAYGGIRWGTGISRAFQYEKTQSRIGGSLWEYPMRYVENSPLFWADKITTPLLMMANDADDAVPWYQGIEMFIAMRRLNKEAYLLVYNGDGHNPAKRADQKDVALKMQQFFDNKLKGDPAPEWMTRGVPFLAKGYDQLNQSVPGAVQAGRAP